MSRQPTLLGIGVDILNKKRFSRLWSQYSSDKFDQLLSPSEKINLGAQKNSSEQFAKRFVAKESFFKALGLNAMGLAGFPKMSVEFLEKNDFIIRTKLPRKKTEIEAKGIFFESDQFFGAHIMVWR